MVGCMNKPQGKIIIESDTSVLRKPYPQGHPAEDAKGKNSIVKVLSSGEELMYYKMVVDKDFAVYEVKVGGEKGFIVHDSGFKIEKF